MHAGDGAADTVAVNQLDDEYKYTSVQLAGLHCYGTHYHNDNHNKNLLQSVHQHHW